MYILYIVPTQAAGVLRNAVNCMEDGASQSPIASAGQAGQAGQGKKGGGCEREPSTQGTNATYLKVGTP